MFNAKPNNVIIIILSLFPKINEYYKVSFTVAFKAGTYLYLTTLKQFKDTLFILQSILNNNEQSVCEFYLFYIVTEYSDACDTTMSNKRLKQTRLPRFIRWVMTFETPCMCDKLNCTLKIKPKTTINRIIVILLFEEGLNHSILVEINTHKHKASRGVLLTLSWANKRTLVDCCSLRVKFMCCAWYSPARVKCFVLGFLDIAPTALWVRSLKPYSRIVKLNCQTLPLQQIRFTLWDVVVSQSFVFAISLIFILFVIQIQCLHLLLFNQVVWKFSLLHFIKRIFKAF